MEALQRAMAAAIAAAERTAPADAVLFVGAHMLGRTAGAPGTDPDMHQLDQTAVEQLERELTAAVNAAMVAEPADPIAFVGERLVQGHSTLTAASADEEALTAAIERVLTSAFQEIIDAMRIHPSSTDEA
eukprot:7129534-Prymnesium_polylepis.1